MSTIYNEALLDAKKIRESAEKAARDKIMETITPQIRELINKRILSEQVEDFDEADDYLEPQTNELDGIFDSMPEVDLSSENEAMRTAADNANSVFVYAPDGDVNIEVDEEDEEDVASPDVLSDDTVYESFARMVKNDFVPDRKISLRVNKLFETISKLSSISSIVNENMLDKQQHKRMQISLAKCLREAIELKGLISNSGRGTKKLMTKLDASIKEMKQMSSKYKKNLFDFLFEEADKEEDLKTEAEKCDDDKEDLDESDDFGGGDFMSEADDETSEEVSAEEPAEETPDLDMESVKSAFDQLKSALGLSDEEETEEVSDESGEESGDQEEVFEIDESVLRRELSKMKRNRKLRETASNLATDKADQFGGGEVEADVFEVDGETFLNVLEDELGRVKFGKAPKTEGRRPDARLKSALSEAAEYKKVAAGLKQQLVEMNLFNAKLLYSNKLLQNKNLTIKQQRAIVEALDNAKTIREAKLLYKSLSESLARKSQNGGKTMSESVTRTLGSSSKSTRSGQPAKNGVETDRWAVLAGIGKN